MVFEPRVNGEATLDAGTISNRAAPRAVILKIACVIRAIEGSILHVQHRGGVDGGGGSSRGPEAGGGFPGGCAGGGVGPRRSMMWLV